MAVGNIPEPEMSTSDQLSAAERKVMSDSLYMKVKLKS